jgi:uncharacterized protein (UPF0335 family)
MSVVDMNDFIGINPPKESSYLDQEARQKLTSYIERIERLEEEKATLSEDVSDIFKVAKSEGFDTKAMRQVIRLRRKDAEERKDELNALDVYLHALDMF